MFEAEKSYFVQMMRVWKTYVEWQYFSWWYVYWLL